MGLGDLLSGLKAFVTQSGEFEPYFQALKAARATATPPERLARLAGHWSDEVKARVASNPNTPLEWLLKLIPAHANRVLGNPQLQLQLFAEPDLWSKLDKDAQDAIAQSSQCPESFIRWTRGQSRDLCFLLVQNERLPRELRQELFWEAGPDDPPASLLTPELAQLWRVVRRKERPLTEGECRTLFAQGHKGREAALEQDACPDELIAQAAPIEETARRHPRLTLGAMRGLLADGSSEAIGDLLQNESLPFELIDPLFQRPELHRFLARYCPLHISEERIAQLLKSSDSEVARIASVHFPLELELERQLARSLDDLTRSTLAHNAFLRPGTCLLLADGDYDSLGLSRLSTGHQSVVPLLRLAQYSIPEVGDQVVPTSEGGGCAPAARGCGAPSEGITPNRRGAYFQGSPREAS